MKINRLAHYSRIMATLTLIFIIAMLLLNILAWLMPDFVDQSGFGFGLAMTESSVKGMNAGTHGVIIEELGGEGLMPWWQLLGGIIISSIPLFILARGLNALRCLFLSYGEGDYFSAESAALLGKVGQGVALWVLYNFILEPVMSIWITLLRPEGERLITLSFDSSSIVALFLAASIMVIARILGAASALARENEQFI